MKAQAFMLVPMVKLSRHCQALARASWARSSAWAGLPVMVRAKARMWGMRATRSVLKVSSLRASAPVACGWSLI